MAYIPKALRQQIFERANGLCEYCQSSQIVITTLEVDHILPVSLDGKTAPENLCASCAGCNRYKKREIEAIDPQTQTIQRLFNPRQQVWHDHFRWDEMGVILIGLTPIGRATIVQLKINRPDMIISRQVWVSVGWHPPK
ncbi:MAG: HNH endonuclease signature motif containing protein [bacterium]|nr:HNH endonuclease signature motif containing protein [bacterium]